MGHLCAQNYRRDNSRIGDSNVVWGKQGNYTGYVPQIPRQGEAKTQERNTSIKLNP